MAKGFFISKTLGIVGTILGIGAVASIIALSVAYSQEKERADQALAQTTAATAVPASTAPAKATTASSTHLASATSPPTQRNPWDHLRLPRTLKPTFYTVSLWPSLTRNDQGLYIFRGNSTVQFQCVEPTDLILIHSKKLNYTLQGGFLVSLMGVGGASPPAILHTWLEEKTEYLVVQLSQELRQNQLYELQSRFTGELADDLAGFYRSEYKEDGEARC